MKVFFRNLFQLAGNGRGTAPLLNNETHLHIFLVTPQSCFQSKDDDSLELIIGTN